MATPNEIRSAVQRAIAAVGAGDQDRLPGWADNRLYWLLCQHLRSVLPADTPASELEPYALAYWHAVGQDDENPMEWDEAWQCVCDLWDAGYVRYAAGATITDAIDAAERMPCRPELRRYNDTRMRLLGMACYVLATRPGGDGRFFLSCRHAGLILGVSHVRGAAALRRLQVHGVIAIRHPADGPKRRATEYTYLLR